MFLLCSVRGVAKERAGHHTMARPKQRDDTVAGGWSGGWRRPDRLTWLYLDFDSFFASVEQQDNPELRGRAVAITPSALQMGGSIAVSREAKAAGCARVGGRPALLARCPDMAFVAQRPTRYIEVHNQAVSAINGVVPVFDVRGVDEMAILLDPCEAREPEALAGRINAALAESIGPFITASLGFSTNRVLAKMASAFDKPCGVTVWHPRDWPGPLRELPFAAVPGIGERMAARLEAAGVPDLSAFLDISPKRARKVWGNVLGERMWYRLQGYDLRDPDTETSMIGHGRVLPRDWQGLERPYGAARFLVVKAARRMRRWGLCAGCFYLGIKIRPPGNTRAAYTRDPQGQEEFHRWATEVEMPGVDDDHGCLSALREAWSRLERDCGALGETLNIAHVQIALTSLCPKASRQSDLFADPRPNAAKWAKVTEAVDSLTRRYQSSPIMPGRCEEPPGGNAGTKIAFGRVPEAEDAH